MQVRIPYSLWFECQMYLNQNYIMPIVDYTLITGPRNYTIEFYNDAHYQQFWTRFGSRLYMH